MSDAYRKELRKFDTERVLVAWDALVAKQQTSLENMAVPAMFVTDTKADREVGPLKQPTRDSYLIILSQRQQRVIQVLEGIASSEDR